MENQRCEPIAEWTNLVAARWRTGCIMGARSSVFETMLPDDTGVGYRPDRCHRSSRDDRVRFDYSKLSKRGSPGSTGTISTEFISKAVKHGRMRFFLPDITLDPYQQQ